MNKTYWTYPQMTQSNSGNSKMIYFKLFKVMKTKEKNL